MVATYNFNMCFVHVNNITLLRFVVDTSLFSCVVGFALTPLYVAIRCLPNLLHVHGQVQQLWWTFTQVIHLTSTLVQFVDSCSPPNMMQAPFLVHTCQWVFEAQATVTAGDVCMLYYFVVCLRCCIVCYRSFCNLYCCSCSYKDVLFLLFVVWFIMITI